jgi:predicted DNA-binding protein (UPF0278 family)
MAKSIAPINEYETIASQKISMDGADKLKMYKELLDNGTIASANEADQLQMLKDLLDADMITQDEFIAKKKQILGL